MAPRYARTTAARSSAADRGADGRRQRFARAGASKGLSAGASGSGMGRRTQRPDRLSLGRWRRRAGTRLCRRGGCPPARRNPSEWHERRSGAATRDPDRTDRVRAGTRSGRKRLCRGPCAAGRQRYQFEPEMGGKWLEVFKEIAPRVRRVALIFNPETQPAYATFLRSIEAAAPSFAVEPITTPVHSVVEIENAMTALGREAGGSFIVIPDVFTSTNHDPIVALAARYRLPALYPFPFFARKGGLVSYGIDVTDLFRRSASYIDRILRGTKPGELPVQTPNKFEFVINLKTARALGLQIPDKLVAIADEVIE